MARNLLSPGCGPCECDCICCQDPPGDDDYIAESNYKATLTITGGGYTSACCDSWPSELTISRTADPCEWEGQEILSGGGDSCTEDSTDYFYEEITVRMTPTLDGACETDPITAEVILVYTNTGGALQTARYRFSRDDCTLGVFEFVEVVVDNGSPPFCSVGLEITEV